MKSFIPRERDIQKHWHVIDAEGQILGRCHFKPVQKSNWVPYKEFINKTKQNKSIPKVQDKTSKQFHKDLIKEQKKRTKSYYERYKKTIKRIKYG